MKLQLENEIAVITGGNAGIGRAIALKFAEEGAKIAIFGTNEEKGLAVVEELQTLTQRSDFIFYKVDVSQTVAVDEAIKKVVERFGTIDILVNNAGITADQLLMKMSEEEWDRTLNINLKSCFNTCKAVIRSMMKAKKGNIINISSVVGLVGNPGQTNYAASKAGMIGFSKALAKEVATRGIRVNTIAPGFIETKMTEKLSPEQLKEMHIPLGRMGDPADIAYAAVFLASLRAGYITGQVLTVDGGMVM